MSDFIHIVAQLREAKTFDSGTIAQLLGNMSIVTSTSRLMFCHDVFRNITCSIHQSNTGCNVSIFITAPSELYDVVDDIMKMASQVFKSKATFYTVLELGDCIKKRNGKREG